MEAHIAASVHPKDIAIDTLLPGLNAKFIDLSAKSTLNRTEVICFNNQDLNEVNKVNAKVDRLRRDQFDFFAHIANYKPSTGVDEENSERDIPKIESRLIPCASQGPGTPVNLHVNPEFGKYTMLIKYESISQIYNEWTGTRASY